MLRHGLVPTAERRFAVYSRLCQHAVGPAERTVEEDLRASIWEQPAFEVKAPDRWSITDAKKTRKASMT